MTLPLQWLHLKIVRNNAAHTPARGHVTFTGPYALHDSAGNQLGAPPNETVKLVAGESTVRLPPTNDPTISPQGWTYTVTVDTDVWRETFQIEIPYDVVTTELAPLELADLAEATTPDTVATYALLGHTHTLDSLSDVNVAASTNGQFLSKVDGTWTGVSSAGAPDATALSKGIVQLAGDLGGTAAAPTVPGLAGKAATVHTHTSADITNFTAAVNALVSAGIAALIDSAPGTLDTLNELAAALGDDPNFATTITNLLAGKQPLDSDLTAIAALAPSDNDVLQRIAGAWTHRTPAQLKTTLALVAADVGLSNVNDTSDANKPVSTAQAAADANRGVQAFATTGRQTVAFIGDTTSSWALSPTEYRVTIAAAVGDVLHWSPHFLVLSGGAEAELDIVSVVGGAAARYFSTGTTSAGANGHGGLYVGGNYNRALPSINWVVTADDLDSGNVTLALRYRAAASGVTFGNATYPNHVDLTNLGGSA